MAEGKDEFEHLLSILQLDKYGKVSSDPDLCRNVIVDLGEILSNSLSDVQFDSFTSILLNENGILTFGRNVAKDTSYGEAKKGTLDIIKSLLQKDRVKMSKYANGLFIYSKFLYQVEKQAKVRVVAMEVMCELFEHFIPQLMLDDFDILKFVESTCLEIRSSKASTVLYQQLKFFGILTYSLPQESSRVAPLIFKMLKTAIEKNTGAGIPDLTTLAGAFRGLRYYLEHYPTAAEDEPSFYAKLYPPIHKVLDPSLNLPKRDAQRAALELISAHAAKFSEELIKKYESLFPWLMKWSSSTNRDDHRAALPAMDNFITVISNTLELQDKNEGVPIFKYFLQNYNDLLENGTKSSEISLAVKGYGLLSGACRKFLSPQDVYIMFNRVLNASQHSFFRSYDMLENKITNLPSYIESLAIIINNMDIISNSVADNTLQLALALVEHFPSVSSFKRFLAYRCLYTLFTALFCKANTHHEILRTFVYQAMLHSCSHAPEIETNSEEMETETPQSTSWTGISNETVTCKSFLPLWFGILSPQQVSTIRVAGKPTAVLIEISHYLYGHFVENVIEIIKQLDLSTFKTDKTENQSTSDEETVTSSDPVSGLQARNPKDFQVYLSLVLLSESVLKMQASVNLSPYLPNLIWFLIGKCTDEPLVSSHYTLLTSVLEAAKLASFFEQLDDPINSTIMDLLTGYTKEVVQRCRQYRDELLVACLTLLIKMPIVVIKNVFVEIIPALRMSLQMGISYLPLAEVSIRALQQWSTELSQDMLFTHLPSVLPLLFPYLKSNETTNDAEVQTRIITVRMAFANQRRKVDQKKIKERKKLDVTKMKKVQNLVLHLLGTLPTKLALSLIPQDADTMADEAVRWSPDKHILFATPFPEMKIDIYLDDILPHVVDLALNSSHRQTKVAASELLHSIVIIMIGSGVQMTPETYGKQPRVEVYRRIFEAMLKLACDPDQVTRQLFLTLTFQIIHWFTNSTSYEDPDTVCLLHAIMEGIVCPNNPALRDVSAQCLADFLRWSKKQSKTKGTTPTNVKSILKRVLWYCKHPSAFKRLGGCLAWNSIYRDLREDEQVVKIWTFELLHGFLVCLDLAQNDDASLGTHTQALASVSHIKKIIKTKQKTFNEECDERRLPIDIDGSTLFNLLSWLMLKIGTAKPLVRHTSMEILHDLAPHLKGCSSLNVFMSKYIESNGGDACLIEIVEGGNGSSLSLSKRSVLTSSQSTISCRDIQSFSQHLLAALDVYSWLISSKLTSTSNILSHPSVKVFRAIKFYLNSITQSGLPEVLSQLNGEENRLTPQELKTTNEIKCTVVIRIFDFVRVLLLDGPATTDILLENSILSKCFYSLLIKSIIDPVSVGFDLQDTEVNENLPERLKEILKSFVEKLPKNILSEFFKILNSQLSHNNYHLSSVLVDDFLTLSFVPFKNKHFVKGLEILFECGCTNNLDSDNISTDITKWLNSVLEKKMMQSISQQFNPSHLEFIEVLLRITYCLDKHKMLNNLLTLITNTEKVKFANKEMEKGSFIFDSIGSKCVGFMLENPKYSLDQILGVVEGENNFLFRITLISSLLGHLVKQSKLRKSYSRNVLKAILPFWQKLLQHNMTTVYLESLISLLSLMFLIDRNNIMKEFCNEQTSSIFSFYINHISNNSLELKSKLQALKLLAFFFNTSEITAKRLTETLEAFSALHFPLKSTEFIINSSRDREYHVAISEILMALELTASMPLLGFVIKLFCKEENHRYNEEFENCLNKMVCKIDGTKQLEIFNFVYETYYKSNSTNQNVRHLAIDKVLVPLLRQGNDIATLRFFSSTIVSIMEGISLSIFGRQEEQKALLVTKISSFLLLQILYSKVPKERVFGSDAEISKSFKPNDETGKELTKEVLRLTVKTAKGELRHEQTEEELRRICSCAAYNTLISVLSNVQDKLNLFSAYLFSENIKKDEAIFDSIIDLKAQFNFDVEINFKPGSKRKFVAVRKQIQENQIDIGGDLAGTVHYLQSHYLSDSSLNESLSQFDFSSSVVLANAVANKSTNSANRNDFKMTELSLDQSDFNDHHVMGSLVALLQHLEQTKILPVCDTSHSIESANIPQCISFFESKISNANVHRNVKLFVIRLLLNISELFKPYAKIFVLPLLTCVLDGTVGAGINYFLSDVMVMLASWGENGVPEDSTMGCNVASRVLKHLIVNVPHVRADIFKYNVDVVRTVVESWKKIITVPLDEMYKLLDCFDGAKREVEAGLQLLGIVLANKLKVFDEKIKQDRVENKLLKLVKSSKSSIYNAAAEVVGLLLSCIHEQDANDESFVEKVCAQIKELWFKQSGQAVSCIYYIHKHYPAFISKVINRLLIMLPKLYGINQTRILECITSYASTLENVFVNLKEQNLLEILSRKDASTQVVCLKLMKNILPRLKIEEIEYFMPGVVSFSNHPVPSCRELMYEVLIWVCQNYTNFTDILKAKSLEEKSRSVLLRAVNEEDAILKQTVMNFFLQGVSNLKLHERLLHIFKNMYTPDSEDNFLYTATYLLLENTTHSPDFNRYIFEYPLTRQNFREMPVSTAWQSQHASMVPLFAKSQEVSNSMTSISSLISLTQGADDDTVMLVQATQENQFPQTVDTNNTSAYNWVSGATFDPTFADMEYQATHAPTQGASGGLLFSVGSSGTQTQRKSMNVNQVMKSMSDKRQLPSENLESKLVRRRFVKNQDEEKQKQYFVRQEERRRKLRQSVEKERKLRREGQVTMYRKYRIGELPDIQIPHRAIIAPLQALAQNDPKIAEHLFVLFSQGIIGNAENNLPLNSYQSWSEDVNGVLNNILGSTYLCQRGVIRASLQLVMNNDFPVDPNYVTTACLGSRLENVGALILERQILVSKQNKEKERCSTSRKKMKLSSPPTVDTTTNLWLCLVELYKSLDMWDEVRGILKKQVGNLKEQTQNALECESLSDYLNACKYYKEALDNTMNGSELFKAEKQMWEDSFCMSAAMLGEWKEIESFLEESYISNEANSTKSLESIWMLPQSSRYVLPYLVNSKLMNILAGSKSDGNLCEFVDKTRKDSKLRKILESELPLQLAVLSVNQEELEEAKVLLTVAVNQILSSLSQYSILISKPIVSNIQNLRLLNELDEYLYTCKLTNIETIESKVKAVIQNWKTHQPTKDDPLITSQFLTSYRSLYCHFLQKKIPDNQQMINDLNLTKSGTQIALVKTALLNSNPILAFHYLDRLKSQRKNWTVNVEYQFLKLGLIIQKSKSKTDMTRIQYLIEGGCKNLTTIDDIINENQDNYYKINHLKIKSQLYVEICEAIKCTDHWDHNSSHLNAIVDTFENIDASNKESFFSPLLGASFNGLKQACDLNTAKQTDEEDVFICFIKFCENSLEEWPEHIHAKDYHESLIKTVLKAMSYGVKEAHFRFPHLIHILEKDAGLINVFRELSIRVPSWMFILWMNHILIYYDKAPGPALHSIVERLVQDYPQSIVFPFKMSEPSFNTEGDAGRVVKKECSKVREMLSKFSLPDKFTTAMALVRAPFLPLVDQLSESLKGSSIKDSMNEDYKKIYKSYFISSSGSIGSPDEKGAAHLVKPGRILKDGRDKFDQFFGSQAKNINKMNMNTIKEKIKEFSKFMRENYLKKQKANSLKLNDYSPWLYNFQGSKFNEEIEVPGQYSGLSKPTPEYHTKIASFDENVHLLKSLRLPMQLKIRGNDEKEYSFLVKSGEDMRTDQRVQLIFTLMNNFYSYSAFCDKLTARPFIQTYQVIPLTLEIGLLQWVGQTRTLGSFIQSSSQQTDTLDKALTEYVQKGSWMFPKINVVKKEICVKNYTAVVNQIPWDLLRNSLIKLSSNLEGFFFLRSMFASSYGTLCVSHWILGIGDRHLENCLISLKNGKALGIDFGHHFETATQFLPYPELMPFRLTPQIVNALLPVGYNGVMRETMIASLKTMNEYRKILISAMEAFAREPTNDWIEFVKKKEASDISSSKIKAYSDDRMKLTNHKLKGINPSYVTQWALNENRCIAASVKKELVAIVKGVKGENVRADFPNTNLTVTEQVDCLLDLATDPNILARTYCGWKPYC